MNSGLSFAYFGGEPLGAPILEALTSAGLRPALVITSPDRLLGRKQTLTPPPVKTLAERHNIATLQPTNYKDGSMKARLRETNWDVFVVVAYNFILPTWLLSLPQHGTINVHPSLLPKLRGASPIRSAILQDEPESVGVSVMLLDEKMDHGPLLAQMPLLIQTENWPPTGPELDAKLIKLGGELLIQTLPNYIAGEITPKEQNHNQATYCGRFNKEDSKLDIDPLNLPSGAAAWQAWLKINAFTGIGDTFFTHLGKRVKIKKADLTNDQLRLSRVIPEGKNEMNFSDYLKNHTAQS